MSRTMLEKNWKRVSRRVCSDHRILRVREDLYRVEPGAVEREYVVIESPDWVNVVALTDDERVVLIRPWRQCRPNIRARWRGSGGSCAAGVARGDGLLR